MNETTFHEIMSEINADSNKPYKMTSDIIRELSFNDCLTGIKDPEIVFSSERKETLLYYKLNDNSNRIIAVAQSVINEMNKIDLPVDQKLLNKLEKLIKTILSPQEYNRLVKSIAELIKQLEYLRDSKVIERFPDKPVWRTSEIRNIVDLIRYFQRFPNNYEKEIWPILGEFIAQQNSIVLYYNTIWDSYTDKRERLTSDFTYYSYIREVLSHELCHYYHYHLVLQNGSERQWNKSNKKIRFVKECLATSFEYIWLRMNGYKDLINTIVLDKVRGKPFPENPYTAVLAFRSTNDEKMFLEQVFKESVTDWNKAFRLINNEMQKVVYYKYYNYK